MKKRKIATIIASGSLVGSLLLGGNAYATTTDTPVIKQSRRQNTEYPKKQRGTTKNRSEMKNYIASSTPLFIGTIQSLSGSSFTIIGSKGWGNRPFPFRSDQEKTVFKHASTSPFIYTVKTSSSTVYMRNGKLDSLNDLAVGQRIMISGILDSTMSIIQAKGVNIITSTSTHSHRDNDDEDEDNSTSTLPRRERERNDD